MSTKHTPGPWVWTDDTPSQQPIVALPRGLVRINMWSSAVSEAEAKANARLIAAAPELLEAIKAVRDAPLSTKAIHAMHAAIAKAEGK